MLRWFRAVYIPLLPRRSSHVLMLSRRGRVFWVIGNICMVLGILVLLYVGALFATDAYGVYAARGDTNVPALDTFLQSDDSEPAAFSVSHAVVTAPTTVPTPARMPAELEHAAAPVAGLASQVQPTPAPTAVPPPPHESTVSRVIIPSIALDSKVVEVGWEMTDLNGEQVPVWQVAKYAVGQHRGSANPGEGNNIVLAGHVGGYGHVFRDLYYVHPGDSLTVVSNGQQYSYKVSERIIVNEEGASAEQQAENAKLIAPTGSEMVTLVTCWPATGPDKFTHRVVIRALPAE